MTGRSAGLSLESIYEAPPSGADLGDRRGGPLPPELAKRYKGEIAVTLHAERPTVIANFVTTLDGVVAMAPGEPSTGGGEISGFSEADRYQMALLRSLADVVIVGAGTVRVGKRHEWTARHVQPALDGAFAAWRSGLRLAPHPTTIVVTASGNLDTTHTGLNAPEVPVIVATTTAGAERLSGQPASSNIRVEAVGEGSTVPAKALLEIVRGIGARLALCEGGPHLFGDLLRARLVDELFLTVAPQVLGRDAEAQRLAFVEGTAFGEGHGRWAKLASVRRAGDDLFLRYRFEP